MNEASRSDLAFQPFPFRIVERQRHNDSRQIGAVASNQETLAYLGLGRGYPGQAETARQSRTITGACQTTDGFAFLHNLRPFRQHLAGLYHVEAHQARACFPGLETPQGLTTMKERFVKTYQPLEARLQRIG